MVLEGTADASHDLCRVLASLSAASSSAFGVCPVCSGALLEVSGHRVQRLHSAADTQQAGQRHEVPLDVLAARGRSGLLEDRLVRQLERGRGDSGRRASAMLGAVPGAA